MANHVCCPNLAKGDYSYSHMFKAASTKNNQNSRRLAILKSVKERRNASIDEKRGISEIFDDEEASSTTTEEPMDVTQHHYRRRKFGSKLMLSEYFIEKPEDLEGSWMIKFCPYGIRNLVVAQNRTTKSYNRSGVVQAEFVSLLPGGGPNNKGSKFTILDCVYNPNNSVYYVLDILAWNSYSLVNCSTEFRFFFLCSKLEETQEIAHISKHNKFPFFEVPGRPAQLSFLENVLSQPVEYSCLYSSENLDGILFYHSEVDYRAGVTPLVGWLKPFMVPEILEIPVHESYMEAKPVDYISLKDYVDFCKKKCKSKRPHKKVKDVEMVECFEEDLEMD